MVAIHLGGVGLGLGGADDKGVNKPSAKEAVMDSDNNKQSTGDMKQDSSGKTSQKLEKDLKEI